MPMNIEEIKGTIKNKILIERLELEDMTAEEIDDDEPLFVEGLGLDSVEAMDVVAGIEEEFGFKLPEMTQEQTIERFHSVNTLAQFIQSLIPQ